MRRGVAALLGSLFQGGLGSPARRSSASVAKSSGAGARGNGQGFGKSKLPAGLCRTQYFSEGYEKHDAKQQSRFSNAAAASCIFLRHILGTIFFPVSF